MDIQEVKLNPDDYERVICKCGSMAFQSARLFLKIPGILIGVRDKVVAVPFSDCNACVRCGTILKPDGTLVEPKIIEP